MTEDPLLDFRYQIRLLHIGEFNPDLLPLLRPRRAHLHLAARLVARHAQIQRQPAVAKTFQPPFEVPIVAHRIPRRQLHPAAHKALKLSCFAQLPVQPRRRNFQRIACRYRILDIKDGAKLAAEVHAISMRHSCQRIATRRPGLVKKHAQHAGIAAPAKLQVDHFQPAGGRYPLRNLAYPIKLKCHASNNLQPTSPSQFLGNEKVGLRPLVCFAKLRYYTTVLSFLIYAPTTEKDKSPNFQGCPTTMAPLQCHGESRRRYPAAHRKIRASVPEAE